LLLGLVLATWLVVFHSRPPAQKTVLHARAGSSDAVPRAPVADRGAKPETTVVENEAPPDNSSEKIPAIESSWAGEMRELKALAAQDAEAALARVAEMSEKHERKSAAQAVCLIVAEKEPAKAMLAAWSHDLGKFTDESSESTAVETLARKWAEADLVKAFVWASALPPDDEARRDRVVKGIALALAQVAPAEAASLVARHIHPDSAVHIDAAIEVLRAWAAQEYSGAMAWASLFPSGALRERGIEELANVAATQPATENKTN
jgi:hypothetical protein